MGGKIQHIGILTERMMEGLGVDLVNWKIAEGLVKNGFKVTVFAATISDFFTHQGFQVQALPLAFTRRMPAYHLRALALRKFLQAQPVDVWLIATEPFFPLTPFLRRSLIYFHGNSPPMGLPFKSRLNFAYTRLTQNFISFPSSSHILVVSEFIKKSLPARYQKKAVVLYHGLDHYSIWRKTTVEVKAFRQSLGVEREDILLLYAGRLNPVYQPYKGVFELLSLFSRWKEKYPRTHLLMVGYGDEEDKRLLESRGAKVILKAPMEEMPLYFQACDGYVTCSRWEGFDLPLAEAMAFRKPVVAYDVGAHPELVQHGKNGFLARDSSEFFSSVETLIRNPELREDMGKQGMEFSRSFRWDSTVERLVGWLKEWYDESA